MCSNTFDVASFLAHLATKRLISFLAQLSQRQRCLYNRYEVNKSYKLQISGQCTPPHPTLPRNQDGPRLQIITPNNVPLYTLRPHQIGSRSLVMPPPNLKKFSMDGQDLTMIQLDLIQMDDYPVGSCAINPTAFLLYFRSKRNHKLKGGFG